MDDRVKACRHERVKLLLEPKKWSEEIGTRNGNNSTVLIFNMSLDLIFLMFLFIGDIRTLA